MTARPPLKIKSAAHMEALGAELALFAQRGDFIALSGPLGCGKTTLARGLIRAVLDDQSLDVPSPTFNLMQTYESGRLDVAHFDLYRIEHAGEIVELGLEDAIETCCVVIEWPDHAVDLRPADCLDVKIEIGDSSVRTAHLSGQGSWGTRLERLFQTRTFLSRSRWRQARRCFLKGDASTRRYERLVMNHKTAILMDAPARAATSSVRAGKSYAKLAHLAVNIEPFVALTPALRALGLSAPDILAQDLDHGFLLLEDLGAGVLSALDVKASLEDEVYETAVDLLAKIATHGLARELPVPTKARYVIPEFDFAAFMVEARLLLDWLWPLVKGARPDQKCVREFEALWRDLFDHLRPHPKVVALRDYHSPNLLWLPDRMGIARIGVIDYQDAVMAPLGYDLVSLLQDARIDVSQKRESAMRRRFFQNIRESMPAYSEQAFDVAYAILGAQRNTKILGIFARLARRDGKSHYLKHLPRVSNYLDRCLEHPDLKQLDDWFAHNLPANERCEPALTGPESNP